MLHWIQSQSTPLIVFFVFTICYAVAVVTFVVATMLSRRRIGDELKTISPTTLTPLAVVLGLLIAFLAARVWDNVSRAREHVGLEASALSEVVLHVDALPPEVRTNVRAAIKQHVAFIVEQEWPAMASLRATLKSEPVGLKIVLTELLSFTPAQVTQQLAQQRAVAAAAQAYEARRKRIRMSQAEISPMRWAVILVLATLILATIALIHIGRPAAMATTLFIFSTAVAACLILLMTYDRPFAAGGITMRPDVFREIVLD